MSGTSSHHMQSIAFLICIKNALAGDDMNCNGNDTSEVRSSAVNKGKTGCIFFSTWNASGTWPHALQCPGTQKKKKRGKPHWKHIKILLEHIKNSHAEMHLDHKCVVWTGPEQRLWREKVIVRAVLREVINTSKYNVSTHYQPYMQLTWKMFLLLF